MSVIVFAGTGQVLDNTQILAEAQNLGVDPAIIHAVLDVESGGSGFLPDGRPKILFEAHVFYRQTGGRYAISNINVPHWDRSLYGAGGAHQYDRLAQAMELDREAALKSASWGLFQILGENYAMVGYSDVEQFVKGMVSGEAAQLRAFGQYCVTCGIAKYLQSTPPKFADFSRGYNGPGYAANAYDTKLAAAWRKWLAVETAHPNPAPRTQPELFNETLQVDSFGPAVKALQQRLVAVGYDISVDSDFGPETLWAVVQFQKSHGLVPDGIVGKLTRTALEAA